ncbi:MAG: hypothetical protein RL095_2630 [Verrucomicrobiota bacterium]|jgi:hypothetical protein
MGLSAAIRAFFACLKDDSKAEALDLVVAGALVPKTEHDKALAKQAVQLKSAIDAGETAKSKLSDAEKELGILRAAAEAPRTDVIKPAPPSDPLLTLVLLQREARLVDFAMEDISGYSDEMVGAAARQVHGGVRKVLDRHFSPVPVVTGFCEGDSLSLPQDADLSQYELTGRVKTPPFKGELRHKGWKASTLELPQRQNPGSVIAPAEVEIP